MVDYYQYNFVSKYNLRLKYLKCMSSRKFRKKIIKHEIFFILYRLNEMKKFTNLQKIEKYTIYRMLFLMYTTLLE